MRQRVEVTLVGELARDPTFPSRVTSWFSPARFDVAMRTAPSLDPRRILAPDDQAVVHVWVTLSRPDQARLYFTILKRGEPDYLLRDLRLDGGLDEIGAEHIAEVLHLSTLALLEGQFASTREDVERSLGVSSAAPPPTEAQPPQAVEQPAPKPETASAWGVAFGYGVSPRSDEGIWHGPRAGVRLTLGSGFGIAAGVQSALPHTGELELIELRFYGASFVLGGSYRHAFATALELEWFAGPGVDLVHYKPVRSLDPAFATGAGATEGRPQWIAGLGLRWGEAPALAIVVQGAFALTDTKYEVDIDGERSGVGRASGFVPTVGIEAAF